ncbi:hypothetical protein TNCV_3080981 [Trichonephila clavipes]|nr:hypothetical protein TNCV_3080981 [Trichonephila clavipes]
MGNHDPVGSITRQLKRDEAVARFHLTRGHDFLEVYLHWLLTRSDRSEVMPGWMATTCCNALDSMNIRLTVPSVGTGRIVIKW